MLELGNDTKLEDQIKRAEFIITGGKQKVVKEKLPPGSPPPHVIKRIKDGIKKSRGG